MLVIFKDLLPVGLRRDTAVSNIRVMTCTPAQYMGYGRIHQNTNGLLNLVVACWLMTRVHSGCALELRHQIVLHSDRN